MAIDLKDAAATLLDDMENTISKGISSISDGIASLLHLNESNDNNKIEVNITKLRETSAAYNNCKVELEDMLKDLSTSMDNLKAHWEGEAQKSYFENAFPQFTDSMNKHISMVAFLEKELTDTADKFESLDSELRSKLA